MPFFTLKNSNMIAVYNTDKKELMAIFASTSMAASYIFGQFDGQARERIQKRLIDKFRITDSRFAHPVAVRHATNRQVEMVGDKHGIIFECYPPVKLINIGGIKYTNFENAKAYQNLF
jgi:hypothetical protein